MTEDMAGIPRVPFDQVGPRTSWVTPFEDKIMRENAALRDEVRRIHVRPLPPSDDPGHRLWAALMEDLRDDGLVRLAIRDQVVLEVCWEPTEGTNHA